MAEPLVAQSVFDRLLRDRIIWLGSEVRDDNANAICAQLLLLAAEDPQKDIWLYINSPGGSVTAGMGPASRSPRAAARGDPVSMSSLCVVTVASPAAGAGPAS